ncbi:prolyl oligopeptidase family serine peptidase [Acidisarcina polymorpha]|nr:prolyl oligopeptidase family serine peptidase [Acidisarcina polymorpha]
MTTFSDPDTRLSNAEGQRAPDGKHFFIITTRGILRTNQLGSILWYISAGDVKSYLHTRSALAPKPHLLVKILGTPKAQQTDSYGSLITQARWSTDSKTIFFLAEQPDGHRHLFRTGLSDKRPTDLTPGKMDVSGFSEAGGTIAYIVAEHPLPPKVIGGRIDDASTDLTGLSLFQILFPKTFPDESSLWPALDLWVHFRGVNRKVNAGGKWYFPASAKGLRVAVSPNGRALIAARPVPEVPVEWHRYKTANDTYNFSTTSTGTDPSGRQFTWPWQYIYVDLSSMKVVPLVNAPSGFIFGYRDSLEAVWSRDSAAVLFTNTYLPLQSTSGTANVRNEVACAAAVYTVASRSPSCAVYTEYPKGIDGVAFGRSTDEVLLHWKGESSATTEAYRKVQQEWNLGSEVVSQEEPQSELKLFIRQDINESPKLWVSDPRTVEEKELWDPNPQLSSFDLGRASIYSWKDNSGGEWRGGLVFPPNFVRGHRYPLVIQTHGFPNEHEFLVDGSFTTGFAARPLAAGGAMVLQMGSRSGRNSGSAKDEARIQILGFKSAIDQLDRDGLIDSSRVGLIGFSRTAWYAEEALVLEPHLFHAASIIDGVDQSYMNYMLFSPENPWGAVDEEAVNGGKPFGSGLQSWTKNAAGFNLDKVQAPVRIEALGDTAILEEWEIYSALRQQGKPVDLVNLPNAQHILQQPQDRYASQQGNVDWFRFWLQGYKDPDPSKKEQYVRWDKLRPK